ncbi:hypothetical protein JCM19275_2535 [Nonlabens ulvanivorans]|uniref:Uncharacterized protein n=1 Tax=Nonlabens ulvanivorans TaxID=906888 RepID=A0A090WBU0_NONUL|nr:hypothetical protein [Nonlabens ulvanivorans]GAL73688.1 hypothetical protein JCM19275_2535 [Nonlabens ulvanivorans]
MKHTFLALFILCSLLIDAQVGDAYTTGINFEVFQSGVQLKAGNFDNEIKGTRYLNDEYVMGSLEIDGQSQGFFLKYDIYSDSFLFSTSKTTVDDKYLTRNPELVIKLNGKTFQYFDFGNEYDGYYEIVGDIDSDKKLLIKHGKTLIEPQQAYNTGYAKADKPKLITTTAYFILNKENHLTEVENHKKRILRSISDKKNEKLVKLFIKTEDLDFNEDGKSLLKVLSYYYNL